MLKKIIITLAVIIAIPLIAALFTADSYDVERSVIIDQPKSLVFNYVKYLKNQDHYSKWANMDPNMEKSYRGVDGTVGFVSAWNSENPDVGQGEQEIIKIDETGRIDYELRFLAPFEATEPAYMIVEKITDGKTKVRWGFSGHMAYPMNIMMWFMDFETIIGNDLQTGLDSLKKVMETEF